MPQLEVPYEIRNSIVYVACDIYLRKTKTVCNAKVPLDSQGKFSGICGVCKSHTEHRYWWLSSKQREFQIQKAKLRSNIQFGRGISVEDFDFVAKEFL